MKNDYKNKIVHILKICYNSCIGGFMTNREKIQSIIIAVLVAIIIFGGAFMASELKSCDVVAEKEVEFEEISMVEFTTLLNADTNSFVYLARPGCGYCEQQQPILKDLVSKYGFTVFYLNTDNLSDNDFLTIFALDTNIFGEDGSKFGTPTMLIVKDGKIVDSIIGLTQSDSLEDFLTKNSIIKK